ncbi:MAG TPA: hypothetical protein VGF86_12125 [Candidatus Tumulicola sp.]
MKSARFGLALIGALAVAACGDGRSSLPDSTFSPATSASSPGLHLDAELYVASASPYFFNAYRLPLSGSADPIAHETEVSEPVPLANDFRHLYVGSFNDGVIYTFSLPLSDNGFRGSSPRGRFVTPFARQKRRVPRCGSLRRAFCAGVGDPSGLAVADKYLYVAGDGTSGNEVLQYALPLRRPQVPSGSVTGFSQIDFLSIAAENGTLYVASTTAGTVGAYSLPLTPNQSAEYTIDTARQYDGATGVAVDRRCHHLYVSLYALGQIYDYKLPYRPSEPPTILQVDPYVGPYGIAVGDDHLFVTDDTAGGVEAFPLPLTSMSIPDAIVPFAGFGAGVTIRSRYSSRPCR